MSTKPEEDFDDLEIMEFFNIDLKSSFVDYLNKRFQAQ